MTKPSVPPPASSPPPPPPEGAESDNPSPAPIVRSPRRANLSRVPRPTFLPPLPAEPSTSLLPSAILRGMRYSIAEGVFAQIFLILISSSFVTALALFMGANDFVLGLITAIPVAAALLQLPAAWLVERIGDRRTITVRSSLGRMLWIIPYLLLFVPIPVEWRLGIAVLAMFVSWALLSVSSNAWLSWMSDLIPPSVRGRFFGTRSTVLALVSLIIIPVGGAILDLARGAGHPELGFLTLGIVVTASAGLSTFLIRYQPEPPFQRAASRGFGALMREPLRDKSFRNFVITLTIWGLGVNLGAPFFSAHALKNLHVSYAQLASLDMTTTAVTLLSQPFWGRLADRVGHRRVAIICMVGASPLALTWLFATPDTLWMIYINNMLSGIWWPGLTLALNNRLMERAPAAGRAGYMAVYSAITGLVAFVASLAGGVVANTLAGGAYTLGPLTINNYQVIFLTAGLIRVSTALLRSRTL